MGPARSLAIDGLLRGRWVCAKAGGTSEGSARSLAAERVEVCVRVRTVGSPTGAQGGGHPG